MLVYSVVEEKYIKLPLGVLKSYHRIYYELAQYGAFDDLKEMHVGCYPASETSNWMNGIFRDGYSADYAYRTQSSQTN